MQTYLMDGSLQELPQSKHIDCEMKGLVKTIKIYTYINTQTHLMNNQTLNYKHSHHTNVSSCRELLPDVGYVVKVTNNSTKEAVGI